MASIYKEILLDADPEDVWSVIRDVGAVHERLAPGFVVDVKLDGDARIVTFADGAVVRELLVTLDEDARRLAYASVGGQARHHNASFQVFPHGEHGTRLVWITDVFPHELAVPIGRYVEKGSVVIKQTLERR